MRILFLYPFPFWGNGSGAFLRELTSQLVKRGDEIAIVAPDKRKLPGIKHFVANPPQNGVFLSHPEWPNAKKFSDMNGRELGEIYSSYLKTSIEAVDAFNPEIIHVFHTAFLPGIARVLKILYGIKFIITTHGSDLEYLEKDRRFIGLINDANRVARNITAVSEFTKRQYLGMFGENLEHKTKVIMGGVDISNFKKDERKIETINKKYNLTGKKVVLFTGRLTKSKGVEYLVRAAKEINGIVLIVGGGQDKANLENLIKSLDLKNVIMIGYIKPDQSGIFHAFYERADVYVSPSVWEEPLGLTILEAMAAGTPVVATRKGGIVSVINDGENGFFIRARNSKQMAEVVNKLLADDDLRKRISANARKTILENFTWEKIAGQFEDIYKKFSYSTSEYLSVVRGKNPQLSDFMRSMNQILRKSPK
jgi:glycosyltransferase involved in cell wall biosynthesis